MSTTARELFEKDVHGLPPSERLRLAAMILQELTESGVTVVQQSAAWSEEDQHDLTTFSLEHAGRLYPEDEDLV